MPRFEATARIGRRTDRNRSAIVRQRHRPSRRVTSSFAIDVATDLHPITLEPENPNMPRTEATARIERRTDRNRSAIVRQRHRPSSLIVGRLTLDVTTRLHPTITLKPKNTNTPRCGAARGGVSDRSDREHVAVGGQ